MFSWWLYYLLFAVKTVIFMWKCKGSFDLDFLYKQFSGKGEILSEKSMYETERVFRHSPCIFLISLTFSCKILNQSLSDRLDYKNLALSVNRDNLFGKGFFFWWKSATSPEVWKILIAVSYSFFSYDLPFSITF